MAQHAPVPGGDPHVAVLAHGAGELGSVRGFREELSGDHRAGAGVASRAGELHAGREALVARGDEDGEGVRARDGVRGGVGGSLGVRGEDASAADEVDDVRGETDVGALGDAGALGEGDADVAEGALGVLVDGALAGVGADVRDLGVLEGSLDQPVRPHRLVPRGGAEIVQVPKHSHRGTLPTGREGRDRGRAGANDAATDRARATGDPRRAAAGRETMRRGVRRACRVHRWSGQPPPADNTLVQSVGGPHHQLLLQKAQANRLPANSHRKSRRSEFL